MSLRLLLLKMFDGGVYCQETQVSLRLLLLKMFDGDVYCQETQVSLRLLLLKMFDGDVYCQELRVSLRLLLLKVFGALCGLGPTFISELLTSVLPLELARDIQTDMTGKDITANSTCTYLQMYITDKHCRYLCT